MDGDIGVDTVERKRLYRMREISLFATYSGSPLDTTNKDFACHSLTNNNLY